MFRIPLKVALTAVATVLFAVVPSLSSAGLLDGCHSTATPIGFPAQIAVCPAGDGQTLADVGARIDIVTRDPQGRTVSYIPAFDIWLSACAWYDPLCWYEYGADDRTDANGATTMTGTLAMGGMDSSVRVWLQAIVVLSKPQCVQAECLPLAFRSADIDGDLAVDMVDLALFAQAFPPNAYDAAADYNFDGAVGLSDLAFFAGHFGHACP